MGNWTLESIAWDRFDPSKVDPEILRNIKAAAMVERNGGDYEIYLSRVFSDDPVAIADVKHWSVEEVQHGMALGRWAQLADPSWDFDAAFARFRAGYQLPLDATRSVRGSQAGEMMARCIVETGTSSYYSALHDATEEPVLKQICERIAGDEFRHYKLFYDHMQRLLERDRLSTCSGICLISRSDRLAVTVTWSVNAPRSSAIDASTSRAPSSITTVRAASANPARVATTRYVPAFLTSSVNCPLASVSTIRSSRVAMSRTVMRAPVMAAPVVSEMVPRIVARKVLKIFFSNSISVFC